VLRLEVVSRLGGFRLEAALEVEGGSVLVLVGESGSGKTTLLRLVAGLLAPERGTIHLDGDPWFDSAVPVNRPAHLRPVGYVAQDYALFPHLTVTENVAFGLRAQRLRGPEVRRRAAAALERLGIAALASRRPDQLSGGQQQRVAVARALVLDPPVLLLDEPLSALDRQTRRGVRGELRRLLAELPCHTLYVTHDPTEALAFGERIAVLEAGRISQAGARDDLLRRPRSSYVAEFLGVNLFPGTVVARADGIARVRTTGGEVAVADDQLEGEVFALIDPREVVLSRAAPGGSAQNVFQGVIEEVVPEPPSGERVRVSIASPVRLVAEVTRHAVASLDLRPGQQVFAAFKASGVEVFD
jgi:molybdate transport system ATP-binding protein